VIAVDLLISLLKTRGGDYLHGWNIPLPLWRVKDSPMSVQSFTVEEDAYDYALSARNVFPVVFILERPEGMFNWWIVVLGSEELVEAFIDRGATIKETFRSYSLN